MSEQRIMRPLANVIDELLAVIPAEEAALRGDLERQRQSSLYQPPESAYPWRVTSAVLQSHLGARKPTEGWKLRVHDIFVGKESGAAP